MQKILMAEPNISEGRRLDVVEAIAAAQFEGRTILDGAQALPDRPQFSAAQPSPGEALGALAITVGLQVEILQSAGIRLSDGSVSLRMPHESALCPDFVVGDDVAARIGYFRCAATNL